MSLPKICTCPTVPDADCPIHYQDACCSLAAMPCSPSSLTPDTNALADEIYARGIKVSEIKMLQHARTLERERDAALATIMEIEEIYIDGCDTYEDWKAMGELTRNFLYPDNAKVLPAKI